MNEFLLISACIILAMVALSLLLVLRGPENVDRMMAAQLLSTGGIAIVLLIGIESGQSMMLNVALTLAVLAAFAGLAFVKAGETADITSKSDGQA